MRAIVAGALSLALGGCGFHLRGETSLPFESIYVQGAATSPFTIQLKREIVAGTQTRVVTAPDKAQVVLHILSERVDKDILTLSGGGRVREYQLRYHVSYRLTDNKNKVEYIAPSEITQRRDYTYSDTEALAKESEEAFLVQDMQTDAARQLLRRLRILARTEMKS